MRANLANAGINFYLRKSPIATNSGYFFFSRFKYRCLIGKQGMTSDKREGDLKTPIGVYRFLYGLVRPDLHGKVQSKLPLYDLKRHDGWCDEPGHSLYNQPMQWPFEASFEKLWRQDHLYNIILVIDHNQRPALKNRGSAIFLHLARNDNTGTEGCLAFQRYQMQNILRAVSPESLLIIKP